MRAENFDNGSLNFDFFVIFFDNGVKDFDFFISDFDYLLNFSVNFSLNFYYLCEKRDY